MSIKNMHYDYKQKLNKIDSNAYVGLKIPEIDRILNRALNMYISLLAEPRRFNTIMGFEKIQRTIDDLRALVVNNHQLDVTNITVNNYAFIKLPDGYRNYLSGVLIANNSVIEKELDITVIKHNNRDINDVFEESDFDWGEVNIRFYNAGIKAFLNNFTVSEFRLDYLKQHLYIHDAEDFGQGTYTLPDGTVLTGHQDCLLADETHDEIVDLAVMLTTGDLSLPNEYQLKKDALIEKQVINK